MNYELTTYLNGRYVKTLKATTSEEASDLLLTLKLKGKYRGECDRIDFKEVNEREEVTVKKVYTMFNLRWSDPVICRKEPEKLHPSAKKPKFLV